LLHFVRVRKDLKLKPDVHLKLSFLTVTEIMVKDTRMYTDQVLLLP